MKSGIADLKNQCSLGQAQEKLVPCLILVAGILLEEARPVGFEGQSREVESCIAGIFSLC